MRKSSYLLVFGALALGGLLLVPRSMQGQAGADVDPALAQLLVDVAVQQKAIAENHTAIAAKIAAVAEDVRVARIFVSRGGGNPKK